MTQPPNNSEVFARPGLPKVSRSVDKVQQDDIPFPLSETKLAEALTY